MSGSSTTEFHKAYRRKDFAAAESIGRDLLVQKPQDRRVRYRLANILERTARGDDAHALLMAGMDPRLSSAIASTIVAAYADLGVPINLADSWRFIPRGASALCSIAHPRTSLAGKMLFTKVVNPASRHAATELDFYTRLVRTSTALEELAPLFIDYRRVEGSPYVMLTLESVRGRRPGVGDVGAVRRAWLELGRGSEEVTRAGLHLKRSRLRDATRRLAARVLGGPLMWPETAAWLHTRRGSSDLFAAMGVRLKRRRAGHRLVTAARRLQTFWNRNALHRKIEPLEDYSFVHGDFHEANLIIDELTGRCRVIDWESASWGPPSLDFSRFAAGLQGFEFDQLKREQLLEWRDEERAPRSYKSPVAPRLLAVLATARWLTQHSPEQVEARFDHTVGPALAWLHTDETRARRERSRLV